MHPLRTMLLLMLPIVGLGALYATWHETDRARLELRDRTDAGLARAAADYLTVVTPGGAVGEFDAPRLLSGAHALAGTSFWKGGLQVLVGNSALLRDSIGLLPLSDSLFNVMDTAVTVTAILPRERVQLVPLLTKSGTSSGAWVAAWGAAPATESGPLLRAAYIGAAGAIVLLAILGLLQARPPWRWACFGAVALMVVLLRAALGLEWEGELRQATELRLLTLRQLVEIAATAPGVRQAMVAEVAASAETAPFALPPPAESEVSWGQDSLGAVATILAATPRTLSGLRLSLHLPLRPESLTGRVMPWLLVLLLAGLVELLSGLSRRPAIFQGNGTAPSASTSPGTA